MLKVYNDLTHQKEAFIPLEQGKVRMYVCGMTVYDLCHLGHARVMVVFDIIYRYLKAQGYEVTYIRNITDIDDKIINRAKENGEPFNTLTERFIEAMHQDSEALGVLLPDVEPQATEHIDEIITMVQRLIDKDHAYTAGNGDVYYSVASFPSYGKLSGKSIGDLRAGARVDVDESKREPLDFVLWKAAKPGEPSWGSPWGEGRPGWHIECSAMSTNCLGDTFDIHGGGADLTFPHHQNEIAQSEGATGHPFVKYWLHNGFVRVNDEKMSKSLGNFFTVREILQHYQAEEVRYFILTSQYRSPLNYDEEHLDNARGALTRFYTALRGLPVVEPSGVDAYVARFNDAMDDDFNTSLAMAVIFEAVKKGNDALADDDMPSEEKEPLVKALASYVLHAAGILGLSLKGTEVSETLEEEISKLVSAREEARKNKDYAEADRLRQALLEKGIALEDTAEGPVWRKT